MWYTVFMDQCDDNGTPESYNEIRSAWASLSSVSFEDHCYKIDYLL